MAQSLVSNTLLNPYDEIVRVVATFPNGSMFSGSGVMVGPNDVLTAAHMLYDGRYGGAATSVSVTPGYALDGSQPLGTYVSKSFHYLSGVDPNNDGVFTSGNMKTGLAGSEADMGVIDLNTAVGNKTGWMSMDPGFSSGKVNITGFPSSTGFHMVNESGTVQRGSADSTLFYTNGLKATAGESGSPLWYADSGGAHVVGVVSTSSWAADIDGAYSTLQSWISGNDYLIGGAQQTPAAPVYTPPPTYVPPAPVYTAPTTTTTSSGATIYKTGYYVPRSSGTSAEVDDQHPVDPHHQPMSDFAHAMHGITGSDWLIA